MKKKLSKGFKPLVESTPVIGRPRIPGDVVVLSLGNLKYSPQLQVRIGSDVMKMMSWKVGDMVSLAAGTVEDGLPALRIIRGETGTHKLVAQSRRDGQPVCAWVKVSAASFIEHVLPLLNMQIRPERCGDDLYVVGRDVVSSPDSALLG